VLIVRTVSSCHPKHCYKSIPFSQAIRVKWIWSTVETTKQRLGDLHHHFKRRGYNDKVIESGYSNSSEINRNNLVVVVSRKDILVFDILCVSTSRRCIRWLLFQTFIYIHTSKQVRTIQYICPTSKLLVILGLYDLFIGLYLVNNQ
jgi:hypothetical protein